MPKFTASKSHDQNATNHLNVFMSLFSKKSKTPNTVTPQLEELGTAQTPIAVKSTKRPAPEFFLQKFENVYLESLDGVSGFEKLTPSPKEEYFDYKTTLHCFKPNDGYKFCLPLFLENCGQAVIHYDIANPIENLQSFKIQLPTQQTVENLQQKELPLHPEFSSQQSNRLKMSTYDLTVQPTTERLTPINVATSSSKNNSAERK